MFQKIFVLLGLVVFSTVAYAAKPQKIGPALVYSTSGNFEDVKNDVIDAIMANGMVISYTAHVKAMLDRTAKDAGVKDSVYGNGESYLMCKAGLSHKLAQTNPHHIVLCPWSISVYTLKGKADKVYVSLRQPYKEEKAYLDVFEMLQQIVNEALGQ